MHYSGDKKNMVTFKGLVHPKLLFKFKSDANVFKLPLVNIIEQTVRPEHELRPNIGCSPVRRTPELLGRSNVCSACRAPDNLLSAVQYNIAV